MFKKLSEVVPGRTPLLTVRCPDVTLKCGERTNFVRTLFVRIDDQMEALTNSKERNEHSLIAATNNELIHLINYWKLNGLSSSLPVASEIFPLEVITGDVALVLEIEGVEYIVSFLRNIRPTGYLGPGGCPRNIEEMFNPVILANRECAEEVVIYNKKTETVYNLFPSTAELDLNVQLWKLKPKNVLYIPLAKIPQVPGHAERLVLEYRGEQHITDGINITIDPSVGSVASTIYRKAIIPAKMEDLQFFDGETTEAGSIINRTVRLTKKTEKEEIGAIFSWGFNVLTTGWCLETMKERIQIP